MRHFLLIVSMILFLSACESKRDNIVVNQLTKELSISAFSDSSFFLLIPCMVEYEGDIYISDITRNDIVVLDSLLLLKKNIASSGRGPEEIISGSYFEISNDTILIGDAGKHNLIPAELTPQQISIVYANEADERYRILPPNLM